VKAAAISRCLISINYEGNHGRMRLPRTARGVVPAGRRPSNRFTSTTPTTRKPGSQAVTQQQPEQPATPAAPFSGTVCLPLSFDFDHSKCTKAKQNCTLKWRHVDLHFESGVLVKVVEQPEGEPATAEPC